MAHQTNYIVFLCYGNESTLHECAYALLSLSRLYRPEELAGYEIWIYTDNPGWFQNFKDCKLPLHYRTIDTATIKLWRGKIDFTHRVKIELLKDLVKDKTGNILYVDSDAVFTHRIDKVFADIEAGKLYMHVNEGVVSDNGNPILKKLNGHLQKNVSMKVNGKPVHDLAMWNAGVLGFNTKANYLLDEVLTFTDSQYPQFPKHVVEQFAFSVYFQQAGLVKSAASYIVHYWNLKEVRQILSSFFAHFGNSSWDELVRNSQLIQMPVLMQEKGNFYSNRSITKALQKKHWLPAKRDWDEMLKQL
jgi:lipopolysaccharide biosynthesis glycosyltransferase